MITNSELKSIDLNVLGEWYAQISDTFSEHKEEEQKEIEYKENDKTIDTSKKGRNMERKYDSMDSQKIDELLKKSIDSFIYETKDIGKLTRSDKELQSKEVVKTLKSDINKQSPLPSNLNSQGNFQRSASQKWKFSKTPVNEKDQRFYQASPMDSGSKRSTDRRINKPYITPQTNQNCVIPPRYSSLMPNQYQGDADTYYAQNKNQFRQMHNNSFNVPRRAEELPENYQCIASNNLNYPTIQHTSLDENMMPSNLLRQNLPFVNMPHQINQDQSDIQYSLEEIDSRPSSQRQTVVHNNLHNLKI